MREGPPQCMLNWTAATEERIAEAQSALLIMTEWARDGHATPEQAEMLLDPCREMIEALYERDLPLAKLADSSSR